jgi:chromosomal replication initiator protein
LNHKQTFATFVVDDGNSLAHAAAMRVASGAEPLANCNPLFIHAGVGMGKTHLLQAIALEATRLGRRARYVTADAFMYGFASSMRAKNALSFKDRMRGYDLLLTDDIQYLQGGPLQNEFCHTLNALLEEGRSVVVAADRPPGELESVDERIRSRLKGGLVVDIQPHGEETRRRILQLRIAAARQLHPAFEVDAEIVDFVARTVTTNGRDLDGAVNRLVALTNHTGAKINLDKVETAIRDLVAQREPRRPRIEDIQKAVANHFSVSRSDLTSARRTSNVVRPRQIAMYLAKTLTPRSLPEIGRRFGGRDHTTVLHAVRKVASLIDQDRGTRDTVELLRRVLTE